MEAMLADCRISILSLSNGGSVGGCSNKIQSYSAEDRVEE